MLKKTSALAIAALMTVGAAAPLMAQDMLTGADAIAKRQELMKSNGMNLRAAGQEPGANAVAAGETLVANFAELHDLWGDDTQSGNTKALPAVWENMDDFMVKMTGAEEASAKLLEAAKGDDVAAYQAAFKEVGATCSGCHQMYKGN